MPPSAPGGGAWRAGIALLAASVLAPVAGNRPSTGERAIHVDQQQQQQDRAEAGAAGRGQAGGHEDPPKDPAAGPAPKFTVGSANILAESKATRTPGGMPGFVEAAHTEHQKRDPEDKDANLWIQEALEKLMFSSDGPGISLLALQEVDMPMYKGLVRFAEGKNRKKKDMIKYWNIHGQAESPPSSGDIPYLVSNEEKQQVACGVQDGKWGEGRAMKCTIAVGGKALTGLFVHGDSASQPALPTTDFDLIVGDFNIKDEWRVKNLFMVSQSDAELLPGQVNHSTLMRSVYKLRKVSQQVENSCNFVALKCHESDKPETGCTCLNMKKECCDPESKDTDLLSGYDAWCSDADFKGIEDNKPKKKQCAAALKICNAFIRSIEPGKVEPADTKVSKEISKHGLDTAKDWFEKSRSADYVWNGNFAKDMGFSLGEPDSKNSCQATVVSPDGLPATALDFEEEREDWIAVIPGKFKTLPKVKVWAFDAVREKAVKTKMAPHQDWPSDHFPIYATLEIDPAAKSGTAARAAAGAVLMLVLRIVW